MSEAVDIEITPEFEEQVSEITGSLYIYCEGRKSIRFYEKLFMHNLQINCIVKNGGSCGYIKNKVLSTSGSVNRIGIIDGDYRRQNSENLYQIDFYSIENLVLIHHDKFSTLKETLVEFYLQDVEKNGLQHRLLLSIVSGQEITVSKDANLGPDEVVYLEGRIRDVRSFLKYVDVKNCVQSFINFQKSQPKNPRHFKEDLKRYLDNLPEHYPGVDLWFMFDEESAKRLKYYLKDFQR